MSSENLILVGDFNRLPTNAFEQLLGLVQTVEEPTRGSAVLDKIFVSTNILNKFSPPVVGPNFGKADHRSIIMRPRREQSRETKFVKVFDFRKSNLDCFRMKLASAPWQKIYLDCMSIQEKCDVFYEFVQLAMKEIPRSYVEMKSSDKPWLTPTLKRLINLKHEAYRVKDFCRYKHYKDKVRKEIIASKLRWVRRQQESPKRIWNIIRGMSSRKTSDLSSLLAQFSSVKEAAEAINATLKKSITGTPPAWDSLEKLLTNENNQWEVDTSVRTIYKELEKLNCRKACGSDGIPVRLLKESAEIIAEPLSHLFSCSIIDGCIPSQWKSTNIIPLPKSAKVTMENLRPISLLPIMSKILEKQVVQAIKPNLLNMYGQNQFGFRPKSSTLCALVSLLDFITSRLDENDVAGITLVSFDMSKAFTHVRQTVTRSFISDPFEKSTASQVLTMVGKLPTESSATSDPLRWDN